MSSAILDLGILQHIYLMSYGIGNLNLNYVVGSEDSLDA